MGKRIHPLNLIVVQADTRLPRPGAAEVTYYYFDDGGAQMAANGDAHTQAANAAVFGAGRTGAAWSKPEGGGSLWLIQTPTT